MLSKKWKLPRRIAPLAGLLLASSAWASTPTVNWNLGAAPESGVTEIRFPLRFDNTPDASGLYFAFYVPLIGGSRPYTGIQPKLPSSTGSHTYQAIFSSFNASARSNDPQCVGGADGAKEGVSCAVRIDLDLNTFYSNRLTVRNGTDGRDYYSGDVYNDVTGARVAHIGSFNLLHTSGGNFVTQTSGGSGGFIEPYLKPGCSQAAYVVYGKPSGIVDGRTYTGGVPTIIQPKSGSCVFAASTALPEGTAVNLSPNAP
ncbi:hypothetical protein [Burkholderia ubonensis]|uniref:hypothetical protein n=1 Tax=Burkholderia ubonensis TaxID=101571 RepID=UPI002ABE1521|nr:hypothetical protein [Burkholderia ubonensis]